MRISLIKKSLVTVFLMFGLVSVPFFAFAALDGGGNGNDSSNGDGQGSEAGSQSQQHNLSCPRITPGIHIGSVDENVLYKRGGDDSTTNDMSVSNLQTFLSQYPQFYPSGKVTGYFGPLTQTAVQAYQSARGIVSSGTWDTTGYGAVGPRTLAAIQQDCGNTASTNSTNTVTTPTNPVTTNTGTGPLSASLTINGGSGASIVVGDQATYAWSSTGAVSASSGYTVDSTGCGLTTTGPFPWVANTVQGTISNPTTDCQGGHTYVVTYTATSATGATASASVTVHVVSNCTMTFNGFCIPGSPLLPKGSQTSTVTFDSPTPIKPVVIPAINLVGKDIVPTPGSAFTPGTVLQFGFGIGNTGSRGVTFPYNNDYSTVQGIDVRVEIDNGGDKQADHTGAGWVTSAIPATNDTFVTAPLYYDGWNGGDSTKWLSLGTHYARICIDTANAIVESNESDNCGPWTLFTITSTNTSLPPAATCPTGQTGTPPNCTTTVTTGTYMGYVNGALVITTQNISQSSALDNCRLNATNNPLKTVRCTWNGTEIFNAAPASTATCPTGQTGTPPNCTTTTPLSGGLLQNATPASFTASPCTIAAGQTSCSMQVSWAGFTMGSMWVDVIAPGSSEVKWLAGLTGSETNRAYMATKAGAYVFKLYSASPPLAGTTVLATATATVGAVTPPPTSTTGAIVSVAPLQSNTLTATGCTAASVGGTCGVVTTWTLTPSIDVVLNVVDPATNQFYGGSWVAGVNQITANQSGSHTFSFKKGNYRFMLYSVVNGAYTLLQDKTVAVADPTPTTSTGGGGAAVIKSVGHVITNVFHLFGF